MNPPVDSGVVANARGRRRGSTSADDPIVRRHRLGLSAPMLLAAAAATVIVGSAAAAPMAVRGAASSQVCAKLGATKAVVTKIFGAGASAADYKASATLTYCDITPRGVSPLTQDCYHAECTDVFFGSGSPSSNAAYQVAQLKRYGDAGISEVAVAGAGSGATLVKVAKPTSNGLGPGLVFAAGVHTIWIAGSLGGPPPYARWEALARAIHAHLG